MNVKKEPQNLTHHAHTRLDEYFWMNQKDSVEVLAYLEEENQLAAEYFSKLSTLQEKLLTEFESRIPANEEHPPFILHGITYQVRNKAGMDFTFIYQISETGETIFLDENTRAKNSSYYELSDWIPSLDNRFVALCEDFTGRRNYVISFRDSTTGLFLSDKIENTAGSLVWANDNSTVFYVKKHPETLREFQVYRHTIGSDSDKDVLIYEEKDERFDVYLKSTLTQSYILIYSQSSTSSECRLIDANDPLLPAVLFYPREKDHLYELEHHENGFYLLTNKNATNKRILFSSSLPFEFNTCKEIIPHRDSQLIEEILVLKNYLVIQTRENGLLQIRILDLHTSHSKFISFEEETYYTGLAVNATYASNDLYYIYNSLTTPSVVYKYNLQTDEKVIWHQKQLADERFDPTDYQSERVWVTANDGVKIPVSIVYKKGINRKESPCLLYGYGAYGYTLPTVFSSTRLSLLDRGFVYAIAHVRGGKYLGEDWYLAGKFLKKRTTFSDFCTVAEYLPMLGYCAKDKIYAQGGSAGGLLMGAVANLAPYLWKGIVAQVPFVDVVTTMLDTSIPLTVGEYEEWGDPNNEEYYYYMLSYSPYDNVKEMDYPAMLITTGYHDSQVQYWEPMKWVAKLRAMRTNTNPLVFECNMDAGHGGGSGRTTERIELAKEFAFILDLEGIEK